MRIVGGKWRGRRLTAPEGRAVRPTSDRLREALLNILEHREFQAGGGSPLPGARVLDGFAGTGALGLEALSRGAKHATFIEKDRVAQRTLEANIAACDAAGLATILRADCRAPPRTTAACDLVFLDPPYGEDQTGPALTALANAGWLAEDALCSVELSAREDFTAPAGFTILDERRYGAARIVILRAES